MQCHNTVFSLKRSAICAQTVYFLHSTMPSVMCLRLSDVSVICHVNYFRFPIQVCFSSMSVARPHSSVLGLPNIVYRTLPKIWGGFLLVSKSNIRLKPSFELNKYNLDGTLIHSYSHIRYKRQADSVVNKVIQCFRNSCSCCSTSESTVRISELNAASPSRICSWFICDNTKLSRATTWTGSRTDTCNTEQRKQYIPHTIHYYTRLHDSSNSSGSSNSSFIKILVAEVTKWMP